jgi:hypothetical protein
MAIRVQQRGSDPTLKLCVVAVLAVVVLLPCAALGAAPSAADASPTRLPSIASGAWMPAYVDGHGAQIVNPYGAPDESGETFDDAPPTGRVFVWNLDTAVPDRGRRPGRPSAMPRHRVGA